MNGTIPVPGPIIKMGVSVDSGITKAEFLMKALILPSASDFCRSYKNAEVRPCLEVPSGCFHSDSEMAIDRSVGCASELEAIV